MPNRSRGDPYRERHLHHPVPGARMWRSRSCLGASRRHQAGEELLRQERHRAGRVDVLQRREPRAHREPSLRPLSPTVGTATPTPSTLGEHRHMPSPTFSPVLLSGSDTDEPSLPVAAPLCRHGSFLAGHNLYSDGIVAVQSTRPCTRPCCAAYAHRTRRRTAPPGAATPS